MITDIYATAAGLPQLLRTRDSVHEIMRMFWLTPTTFINVQLALGYLPTCQEYLIPLRLQFYPVIVRLAGD